MCLRDCLVPIAFVSYLIRFRFFHPLLTSFECGDDVFPKECDEWNGMLVDRNRKCVLSIVFVAVADVGDGGEHEKIDFHFISFFFASLFCFSHSRLLFRYSF